jgi:hypothetical protein
MVATSFLPSFSATEQKLSQTIVKISTKGNSLREMLNSGLCGAGVPPARADGTAAQRTERTRLSKRPSREEPPSTLLARIVLST